MGSKNEKNKHSGRKQKIDSPETQPSRRFHSSANKISAVEQGRSEVLSSGQRIIILPGATPLVRLDTRPPAPTEPIKEDRE